MMLKLFLNSILINLFLLSSSYAKEIPPSPPIVDETFSLVTANNLIQIMNGYRQIGNSDKYNISSVDLIYDQNLPLCYVYHLVPYGHLVLSTHYEQNPIKSISRFSDFLANSSGYERTVINGIKKELNVLANTQSKNDLSADNIRNNNELCWQFWERYYPPEQNLIQHKAVPVFVSASNLGKDLSKDNFESGKLFDNNISNLLIPDGRQPENNIQTQIGAYLFHLCRECEKQIKENSQALSKNKTSSLAASISLIVNSTYSQADYSGDFVLTGAVHNDGTAASVFTKINIVLFDKNNINIGTGWTYIHGGTNVNLGNGIYTNALRSGEKGFFKVWTSYKFSQVDRYTYTIETSEYSYSLCYAQLSFNGNPTTSSSLGDLKIVGEIKNSNNNYVSYFTQVDFAIYNSNSKVIDTDFTYVNGDSYTIGSVTTDTAIYPGQSKPFTEYTLAPYSQYSTYEYSYEWDEANTSTVSVSGRISDSAGTGIQNVRVMIYDITRQGYFWIGVTDANGQYSIAGIPAGKYKVYFNASQTAYFCEYYNDKTTLSAADEITVVSGQITQNINAILGLIPNAGSLRGVVTDNLGTGINNIAIAVYDLSNNEIRTYITTDSNGNYLILAIGQGKYKVLFYGGNYISQWLENIEIVSGQTTGLNVQMVKGGSISGHVTNSAGTGIMNVGIQVHNLAHTLWWGSATDDNGSYSVDGLPPASYKIVFNPSSSYVLEWYNDKTSFSSADEVAVSAGQTINVNAVLSGISDPPTIILTSPNGGESWTVGSSHNIIWITTGTLANIKIEYSANNGANWTTIVASTPNNNSYPWTLPNTPSTQCLVRVSDASTGTPADVSNAIFSIVPGPKITLSKTSLAFGAVAGGTSTSSQPVVLSNSGGGTLSWTAASNSTWLGATPGSGTGTGVIQVSVNAAGLAVGTYPGTISVSDPNASNNPQTIAVALTVRAAGSGVAPFGDFSTPIDGTTGITGAIPVSGWALDDIETTKVEIKRDSVVADPPGAIGPDGLVYIGDAIFVEGARPDVEQAYPGYPLNDRAGWGYMLLTNFLPNQGNGTFKIHAKVTDKEGNVVLLGTKTIICSNSTAVKPFGTIDTPAQGGDASGNAYVNFGWVLTPQPNTVPKDGSTISAWVDGVQVGVLKNAPNAYDQYRADIAGLFPGLKNSGGPVGFVYLDTTKYSNAVHTIYWIATDDAGHADGIGSRYFNIMNTGTSSSQTDQALQAIDLNGSVSYDSLMNLPVSFGPRKVKRGFDLIAEPEAIQPDQYGVIHIDIGEVERVELDLNPAPGEMRADFGISGYSGYLIVGNQLRSLPIGSTLDQRKGTFSWLPGPGFLGEYRFVFIRKDQIGVQTRIYVKVRIIPKFGLK